MNRALVVLFNLVRNRIAPKKPAYHNDALRANQPNEPFYNFSYWRSLVS